ncbi:MAG: type II and III secretion system protein [bacterium]
MPILFRGSFRVTVAVSLSLCLACLCRAQDVPPSPNPSSAAPATAAVKTPASPLPARGTYRITGDDKKLSIFAVSVDAPELFTAIASKTNLPLLVDDQVSRRITINLKDRPARQAITDICSAYGLSVADVEGITMISEGIPRSPSSYLLSDIAAIPTKYVTASNARNLLPVFLQDYVKFNAEQNALVLSAPTEVLSKFRDDIAQFDIPASQIVLDLLLVELTDTSLDEFALKTKYLNGGQGPFIDPASGIVSWLGFQPNSRQFSVALTALVQKGKARVRANPRIATVSGRPASIFVGLQRYIATPIDSSAGGYGGSTNNISAGVRLSITPYTGGKGEILVDVNAEVSTLSALDPITKLPEKSTRTATTTVRVLDGKTIVIGGLTQQESRSVRNKIPLLGDIPFLGPLFFQSKNTETTETELALFITPRILSNTGHLPEAEENALKARFLNSDINKPAPPAPPAVNPEFPPSLRLPRGEAPKSDVPITGSKP